MSDLAIVALNPNPLVLLSNSTSLITVVPPVFSILTASTGAPCNKKWENDFSPIDPAGTTFVDKQYSKAYLHHLVVCGEMLAAQIASLHNIGFYLWLVGEARRHIVAGDFASWKTMMVERLSRRL